MNVFVRQSSGCFTPVVRRWSVDTSAAATVRDAAQNTAVEALARAVMAAPQPEPYPNSGVPSWSISIEEGGSTVFQGYYDVVTAPAEVHALVGVVQRLCRERGVADGPQQGVA